MRNIVVDSAPPLSFSSTAIATTQHSMLSQSIPVIVLQQQSVPTDVSPAALQGESHTVQLLTELSSSLNNIIAGFNVPGRSSAVSITDPAASVWSTVHDPQSPLPTCANVENFNQSN